MYPENAFGEYNEQGYLDSLHSNNSDGQAQISVNVRIRYKTYNPQPKSDRLIKYNRYDTSNDKH